LKGKDFNTELAGPKKPALQGQGLFRATVALPSGTLRAGRQTEFAERR
jgi:hypothetical protein